MEAAERAARAGLALACALFALALPRPEARPRACPAPVERAPGQVFCDGAPEDAARLSGPARRVFGLPIDPNCADATTLETLPGIGPARARAIVLERARRPFASPRDLLRVRGLGPVRVGELAPFLALPAPLASAEASSLESHTCRSCCGDPEAGEGLSRAPLPPPEEAR